MKAIFTLITLFSLQLLNCHSLFAQEKTVVSARKSDTNSEIAANSQKTKNSFTQKVDNISGVDILSNYIKALGGQEQLKEIKSIDFQGTLDLSGMELNFSERKQFPNLDYIALSLDKDTILRSVFTGKEGYNQEIAEKKYLTPEQVTARNRDYLGLFCQLYYLDTANNFSLNKIEKIQSNDSSFYRLDIQLPSGKLISEFYDVKTFLLSKSMETETVNGETTETIKTLGNYKSINGILFPYNIVIDKTKNDKTQHINIIINSIQLNLPSE